MPEYVSDNNAIAAASSIIPEARNTALFLPSANRNFLYGPCERPLTNVSMEVCQHPSSTPLNSPAKDLKKLPLLCCPASKVYISGETNDAFPKCKTLENNINPETSFFELPFSKHFQGIESNLPFDDAIAIYQQNKVPGFRLAKSNNKLYAGFNSEQTCKQAAANYLVPISEYARYWSSEK